MRKQFILLIAVFAVLLVACEPRTTPGGAGAIPADLEPLRIAVIHNNADHPSITAIVQGMQEEGRFFNAEITFFDPAFDPARQVSMIEDSIVRRPHVIVVNAVDPVAVIPAIRMAYESGIPVLTQNANVARDGLQYIHAFVGSESIDQGYAVGRMMVERFGNRNANVIILGGFPGQTDYINRVQGMRDAWASAGVNYTILADQPADWSQDRALVVMQDMLTRFPDGTLDIVFAVDDPMALGAVEAIRAAGRRNIAVYGVNGNIAAFTAIRAGEMAGTALQMSYLVGVYTIRAAHDIRMGRILPDNIMAPTAPVTIDNIDQWQAFAW